MAYESSIPIKEITQIPRTSVETSNSDPVREKVRQLISIGGFANRNVDTSAAAKVVVIGDVAVGKTSLINRYRYSAFSSSYKSTIGVDFALIKSSIFGHPFQLQIWDTAGTERFRSLAPSYYRNANALVIAFDVNDPNFKSSCLQWHSAALQSSYHRPPQIFLVGTKIDTQRHSEYLAVARNLAESIGAELWLTSSKDGTNVEEMFNRVALSCFVDSLERQPITSASDVQQCHIHSEDLYETAKCARCL